MCANQACFPISVIARVLRVSKAGFYVWRDRAQSSHATAEAALLKRGRMVQATWSVAAMPELTSSALPQGYPAPACPR
jgi:hypothetical protein